MVRTFTISRLCGVEFHKQRAVVGQAGLTGAMVVKAASYGKGLQEARIRERMINTESIDRRSPTPSSFIAMFGAPKIN
jgi:hypothetical protein